MDENIIRKNFLSTRKIDYIFKNYISDFIMYLNVNFHNSKKTIYVDLKNIEAFGRYIYFAYPEIKIDEITDGIIRTYIKFCKNELNNNNKTINKKLSALKKFFNYMSKDKHIYAYNIVFNISYLSNEKESPPTVLSSTELIKLFDTMRTYLYGYRDISICKLILETGLPISDILELKIDQLSISQNTLTIKTKYDTLTKQYKLSDSSIEALIQYIEIRKNINKKCLNYLFLSLRGTKYSIRSFQLFFEEAVERSYFDYKYQPRHLRSTFLYNISKLVSSDRLRDISGQNKVIQYYELNNNPLGYIR